jgi:peptidase M42 family hydrolase
MKPLSIDMDYLRETLRGLLETPSPTGYTDVIVAESCERLSALGVDYEVTRRGAIRAVLPGRRRQPARALIAHLDTLGAQLRAIKDNGRAEVVPIGHWSSRFAEGARCTIFSRNGSHRGTILPLKASGHTFGAEVDEQPVAWSQLELRFDLEVNDADDLESFGVEIGDYVGIDPRPEFLDNGFINSRHLDDKAGVATMFAALKALTEQDAKTPVDIHFLFTIAEEVGVGASSVLTPDVASMVAVDNGTSAPGQNSRETGVTIAMADSGGPFDYHLTHKLIDLCVEFDVPHQRDVFRHYRSDSASAIEAGNDIRTALVAFGIDASHGYERVHEDALESVTRLLTLYAQSPVEIKRDVEDLGPPQGLPTQPMQPAED